MQKLSSLQNPRIKALIKLEKRRERDERQLLLVEGLREIATALATGLLPLEAYICPDLLSPASRDALLAGLTRLEQQGKTALYEITPDVYAKVAVREESGGLLLVMPYLTRALDAIPLQASAFLLVVEGVEKPGNLGAILRTADAAGVDGVIVCAGATDVHNPNVVRASLGAIFTVPLAEVGTAEAIDWLRQKQIQVVAATPDATLLYTGVNFTKPTALVMGSEAQGLGANWLTHADQKVKIPMVGQVDSLNLSASTAILLYEVVRQRQYVK